MASWLPIVIIIFAIALVIGPVVWLKPSSRDRKLAELRQRAAASGLKVQMQPLPKSQDTGNAAVYSAQWRNPRRLQTGWGLELQRMPHEMNFDGVWDWRNGREAPEVAKPPLKEFLEMLPADATAVYANDSGLGVQWRERSGNGGLAALQKALDTMRPVIEEAIRQQQSRSEEAGDEGDSLR
ncbi:hypothetical protein JF535_12965 [Microbulbifer salipaludis]|uniref:Preprotein translocase subunit YajC n=1 Tax=Microbulbifer salipaludis TaxID=187980 RepID=A0ABS3E8X5_9GAMM|nr:hypothetical protein [Microbulbifer salipaludis]MBN8431763.1 hypothetical protein [Microbulbifer salipaludis]